LDINNVAHTFTADQVLNQTTGGFTKLGAGTVILNQTNTYTGATAVNGGTLRVNTPGLLDANSVVTVAGGATLGGDGTINGTVSVAANGSLTPGSAANTIGTLTLANGTASALSLNGSDLYFDLPDSGTTCDLIAVTGDLVLTGNSTVYLSAPNGAVPQGVYTQMTYAAKSGSGDINFPNGTKTMWNATLAVSSDSVTVTVASGGLQQDVWKGTASAVWDTSATNWTRNGVAGQAYVAGDAVIFDDSATTFSTISGTVSPSSVIFNNATAYAVSAAIGGAGPLVKDGSGTVTLSGSNTYTGTTTINAGTLKIQGGAFSTKTRNYSIASGAVLNLDGSSINKLPTGTSTISGTGTLRLTGGIVFGNTVSGGNFNLSLSPGALIDVQAGAFMQNGGWNAFNWAANSARLNVDGDFNMGDNWATVDALTGAGTITKGWDANTRVLTVGIADGSGTFSGTIANSSGTIALTKTGTGTQTLSGANTYTGDTKISGGTLTLGNSLALQSSTLDYNSYGGTLDFGALTNATFGGLKGTQNIALTNNFALSVGNNNANTTYSGALSGTGDTLTKIGSGTLTLSATNTYTGATSVSNGVLRLTLAEALASGTAVVISTTTGAKIDLNFTGTVTVRSLTVDGELLTRNKVYSSANLPNVLSGGGFLYTVEGVPPKGTTILVF
jgi:autotransporter-associated beta strand protein